MTGNVEPEEARALHEALADATLVRAGASVVERDFARPQRLSARELQALRERLGASSPSLERAFQELLGRSCTVEVIDVFEADAERVLTELEPPLAAGRFGLDGQPGWLVWDAAAAVAAVNGILGEAFAAGSPPQPRELSSVERRILRNVFRGAVEALARALERGVDSVEVAGEPHELGSWRDGPQPGADVHRLCACLSVEGSVPPSTLHVYLPGFHPAASGSAAPDRRALPSHLSEVTVELRARLGEAEIPLSDLLALEEGDVIPLSASPSGLVHVAVEDRDCATASLGRRHGRYALRIREVLTPNAPSTEQDPR